MKNDGSLPYLVESVYVKEEGEALNRKEKLSGQWLERKLAHESMVTSRNYTQARLGSKSWNTVRTLVGARNNSAWREYNMYILEQIGEICQEGRKPAVIYFELMTI